MSKMQEQIHYIMRQIKNKDSAIEFALRKKLWSRILTVVSSSIYVITCLRNLR